MTLSDIAAGVEVTTEQDERDVAVVDDAATDLVGALRDAGAAAALPCTPEAAATVVERHGRGEAVETAAREAGVAPTTAAKVLHRCGVAGVTPLSPTAREVVRDWLAGELSRTEALALTGASEAEFALGAYVESHEADLRLAAAIEGATEPGRDASVVKRDRLAETMSDPGELR